MMDKTTIRVAIRATARISFVLFLGIGGLLMFLGIVIFLLALVK